MRFVAQLVIVVGIIASLGAKYVSTNFVVEARTAELAQKVAAAAESQREQLALAWFGHKLDRWFEPCKVTVQDGPKLGAGGKTKFKFEHGEVYGWDMFVQGSVERIIDSVIPHEVNHTILACYFRRPVPRWADEGSASLFEHSSEIKKQQDLVNQLVQGGHRIPLRVLLDMKEYPADMQQTLALYAEGYSLTNYLVQAKGRATFLRFLNDAQHQGWDAAFKTFYGKTNVEAFEREWTSWVIAGSPSLKQPEGQVIAQQAPTARPTKPTLMNNARAQSPTPDAATALKQLRRQIRDEQPLPRSDELVAPNPRDAKPREIAARAMPNGAAAPTQSRTPTSSELKPLELSSRRAADELRPIELIRIEERVTPPAAPIELQRFERTSRNQPQRLLRETRLRDDIPQPPKSDKLAPFAQFPSRMK